MEKSGNGKVWKGKSLARLLIQYQGKAVAILDIGWMNSHIHHETERIDSNLIFDTLDFLPRIIANRVGAGPPFEADRTL
jgi:hypothetical protein